MDREYGENYERLYKKHWWWRAREEFLLNQIRSLSLPAQPRILDVGCGNGLLLPALEVFGSSVDGIEFDARLVSESAFKGQIHIGPFDRTFVPGKLYSLILMLDVLEHLPTPEEALQHAAELLEPEGILLLTVPAFRSLWTSHDDLNHHTTRYTKASLRRVVAQAPLVMERMQYFFHWLVPLKLVIRAKEGLIRTKPHPPKVPWAIINRALLGVSRIEQRLACRFPLPMGSSLWAILRRNANSVASMPSTADEVDFE